MTPNYMDPQHMIPSFVQYMLHALLFINIPNVYAVSDVFAHPIHYH